MTARPDWTNLTKDERVEAIKPLAQRGLSAAKIAENFRNVSRNAIIGYCTRHSISLRNAARTPRCSRKAKNISSKAPARTADLTVLPGSEPRLAYVEETTAIEKPAPDIVALVSISKTRAFEPIAGIEPVRLENLGANRCHWPVNGLQGIEPIFCGGLAPDTYCKSHERLAYAPR